MANEQRSPYNGSARPAHVSQGPPFHDPVYRGTAAHSYGTSQQHFDFQGQYQHQATRPHDNGLYQTQAGDIRRPSMQKRMIVSESDAYSAHGSPISTPQNLYPTVSSTGDDYITQHNGFQQMNERHRYQKTQGERPVHEPVSGQIQQARPGRPSVGHNSIDEFQEPRQRKPTPPHIGVTSSGFSANHGQQAAVNQTQLEYMEGPTTGPFTSDVKYGSDQVYRSTAKSKSTNTLQKAGSPLVKNVQSSKPSRERILVAPSSPETISWDNPFPTFPTNKKKATQSDGDSLNGSVAGMSLKSDSHCSKAKDHQPRTASCKSSRGSLRSSETRRKTSSVQGNNDAAYRDAADVDEHDYELQGREQNKRFEIGLSNNVHKTSFAHQIPRQAGPLQNVEPYPYRTGFDLHHDAVSKILPSAPAMGYEYGRGMDLRGGTSEPSIKSRNQSQYSGEPAWLEPGPTAGYHGPEEKDYLPSRFANIHQPEETDQTWQAHSDRGPQALKVDRPSVVSPGETLGDVYDSYYNASPEYDQLQGQNMQDEHWRSGNGEALQSHRAPRIAVNRQFDLTIDEQLQSSQTELDTTKMSGRGQPWDSTTRQPRAKSAEQPHQSTAFPRPVIQQVTSLQQARNLDFAIGCDTPESHKITSQQFSAKARNAPVEARPQASGPYYYQHRQQPMSVAQNQISGVRRNDFRGAVAFQEDVQPQRYRSPALRTPSSNPHQTHILDDSHSKDQQRLIIAQTEVSRTDQIQNPGSRASAISHASPVSPLSSLSANPDALPQHPSPVRPGLIQKPPPTQAPKPAPVRNYNNRPSAFQHSDADYQASPSRSQKAIESVPITHDELDLLKMTTKTNPSDYKTQLVLAKKMVEAAHVLADEGGRADQKQRNKNREKYIFEAHKLVKKLVSNGYPDAMFYLGDCHSRGLLGLAVDPKDAFILYQSAAKAGHAQAAYRVAVCCEMGQEEGGGTRRDPLKAIQWYKRAATLGDTPAMYKMGMIQLKGLLAQAKNPKDALIWLKRAADRADAENPHALHELALLHENASIDDSIIKDEAYSRQLFTQAAILGYKFSQFRLGCAYEYGSLGCPIDSRQSIAWYSKAAVQEEHQSELALSGWYLTGSESILQQSDTEAYLWARKAAQAGLAKAEYAMGYFTEVGIGAPANIDDAKRWYWRAASQNFPKARERLEDLRKGGAKMQKTRVTRSAVNKQSEGECIVM